MNRDAMDASAGADDDDDGPDDNDPHGSDLLMAELSGSNNFFLPPGPEDDEPRSRRVFAAIEVPAVEPERGGDADDEREPVYFECIDAAWCWNVAEYSSFAKEHRTAPLSVLELTSYAMPEFPAGSQPGDIVWFEFGYKPASWRESNGRAYNSLFGQAHPVKIEYHEPRERGWSPVPAAMWLTSQLALSPPSIQRPLGTPSTLPAKYGRELPPSAGVAVYDVGQGSCQALVDKKHHVPLVYVDFGGGVLFNRATFPKEFAGFCFTTEPLIILSHWDWDHWSSAYRFPKAMRMNWLTPKVPETPIQQAFAADLLSRGRLHVWDDTYPTKTVHGKVLVERCTGKTSNDSGFAVTVYSGKLKGRSCLLPGDADYRYIPSLPRVKYNSLCMTHHGGRLHSKIYPMGKRGAVSANSSGPRNSYKHPLFATLKTHLEQKWPMPLQTGFSGHRPCHVLMPWGKPAHLFRGGCHGGECAVAPSDSAPLSTAIEIVAHLVKV